MLANIFDPVQKCCANWTTHSNMYQHSPTSTNIRQQGEQTFPTCCANNVGAMLANMLRWFKPAFTSLNFRAHLIFAQSILSAPNSHASSENICSHALQFDIFITVKMENTCEKLYTYIFSVFWGIWA